MENISNKDKMIESEDTPLSGVENFGRRVRVVREKLGMGQLELARKVGVSLTTIQNYEGGQLPKGEHAIMLARALGLSLDELLLGEPVLLGSGQQHEVCLTTGTHSPSGACGSCAELEAELKLERAERRELSMENRQQAAKIEQLLREISELRVHCTTLEAQNIQLAPERGFSKQRTLLSNSTTKI